MSLLTMIHGSCDPLGIARPSSVVGSSDQQIRQLLGLANQEGKELAKRHNWQRITKEKTITATATEEQSSAIPSDFDRILNGTFYNRTQNRRVEGPMDAAEWQQYKASIASVLFDAYRIRGNSMLLAPTPTADDSYAYEYVSLWWCTTAAGTTPTLAAWAADTDVGILPEDLMGLGVVWRFLKAKGLDYSEPFRTYEAQLMLAVGRDGGKRSVYMGRSMDYRRRREPRWPDGSWDVS